MWKGKSDFNFNLMYEYRKAGKYNLPKMRIQVFAEYDKSLNNFKDVVYTYLKLYIYEESLQRGYLNERLYY